MDLVNFDVTALTPLTHRSRNSQERVEEERFVREREKKFFERKKLELETKLYEHELAEFEATVAPAMAEVEALLAEKGCMVSDDALEALARWKLDLYEDQVPAKKAV